MGSVNMLVFSTAVEEGSQIGFGWHLDTHTHKLTQRQIIYTLTHTNTHTHTH